MKFILKPSLEHIALVNIVILLWNQNDIKALINNYLLLNTDNQWKKIEEKVIEKVSQLSLPHLLKEKVLGFIKPIGVQIKEWIVFHNKCLRLNVQPKFFWTPQATVDGKKTAEMLVKDEKLEKSKRYDLACIYCLEEDIFQLWSERSQHTKEYYSNGALQIISIWTHEVERRGENNAYTSYKDKFEYCVNAGFKEAAEYFLQKLTPREIDESLAKTAKNMWTADVLCFLLPVMNEQQQMEVFKNKPYAVLRYFLRWPLQSFFIETANCMWNFFSKGCYKHLLIAIADKRANGWKDWNYQNLFREFWQESPNAFKSFIVDDGRHLLELLLSIKDKENIRLILKDANLIVKEKLIFKDKTNFLCQHLICGNEWDLLEFFIQQCFPSKNEMLKFKGGFEKSPYFMSASYKEHFARNKQKWDQIFICPDDSHSKYDKISVEEGECSSSKLF